jgi:hypothetical protein
MNVNALICMDEVVHIKAIENNLLRLDQMNYNPILLPKEFVLGIEGMPLVAANGYTLCKLDGVTNFDELVQNILGLQKLLCAISFAIPLTQRTSISDLRGAASYLDLLPLTRYRIGKPNPTIFENYVVYTDVYELPTDQLVNVMKLVVDGRPLPFGLGLGLVNNLHSMEEMQSIIQAYARDCLIEKLRLENSKSTGNQLRLLGDFAKSCLSLSEVCIFFLKHQLRETKYLLFIEANSRAHPLDSFSLKETPTDFAVVL